MSNNSNRRFGDGQSMGMGRRLVVGGRSGWRWHVRKRQSPSLRKPKQLRGADRLFTHDLSAELDSFNLCFLVEPCFFAPFFFAPARCFHWSFGLRLWVGGAGSAMPGSAGCGKLLSHLSSPAASPAGSGQLFTRACTAGGLAPVHSSSITLARPID